MACNALDTVTLGFPSELSIDIDDTIDLPAQYSITGGNDCVHDMVWDMHTPPSGFPYGIGGQAPASPDTEYSQTFTPSAGVGTYVGRVYVNYWEEGYGTPPVVTAQIEAEFTIHVTHTKHVEADLGERTKTAEAEGRTSEATAEARSTTAGVEARSADASIESRARTAKASSQAADADAGERSVTAGAEVPSSVASAPTRSVVAELEGRSVDAEADVRTLTVGRAY